MAIGNWPGPCPVPPTPNPSCLFPGLALKGGAPSNLVAKAGHTCLPQERDCSVAAGPATPPFLPIVTCPSPESWAYVWDLLWSADCCSCFFQYSLALWALPCGRGCPGWGPMPSKLALPVALGRKMPGPLFGTRETGQGKNPALTFIKETRWVAQDAAASPEAKQGWRPTTWPCFALSCSLSPRIPLVATKAQAEEAMGTGRCY